MTINTVQGERVRVKVQICDFSLEIPRTCKEGEERGARFREEALGSMRKPGLGFLREGPR